MLASLRAPLYALSRTYTLCTSKHLVPLRGRAALYPALSDNAHAQMVVEWFRWAQHQHTDGGIPSHIDLVTFARQARAVACPSYPETSGYILCSMVLGQRHALPAFNAQEVEKLLSFLLRAQTPQGSIGHASAPTRGLAFDTGQVLKGLVAYYRHIEPRADVREAITRLANWLSSQIDAHGQYQESACYAGARAYYIEASVGLMHAGMLLDREDWLHGVDRHAQWVMRLRESERWLRRFSFEDKPFQNLHGIAYTLRGLIDVGRYRNAPEYIAFARGCIDAMMEQRYLELPIEGSIPGYFAQGFARNRPILSPTGMCQTALAAFLLAALTSEPRYRDFGQQLLHATKQLHTRGFVDPGMNGLLPGSWPITGPYKQGCMPNWAIKYFLDALYVSMGVNPLALEG